MQGKSLLPFLLGSFFLRKNKKTQSAMAKAIAKRNKQESLLAQLAAMQTYPCVPAMDFSFKIPTLVISGTEDRLIDDTAIEHLAKYLGAEWERVQDVGHSIPLEAPNIFNRIMLRFIAS
jgi:3-oxoadipate enol-lactonase